MKQTASIVTLIGAILETIVHVALIFSTFGIWIIFAAALVPLSWVAHNKATKGYKGWAIYGIVQSFFFCWVGFVGHIIHVVAISKDETVSQSQ